MIVDRHKQTRKLYRRPYVTMKRRSDEPESAAKVHAAIVVEFTIHRDKLAEAVQAIGEELGSELWCGPLHMRVVARQGTTEDGRWKEWEELPDDTP